MRLMGESDRETGKIQVGGAIAEDGWGRAIAGDRWGGKSDGINL